MISCPVDMLPPVPAKWPDSMHKEGIARACPLELLLVVGEPKWMGMRIGSGGGPGSISTPLGPGLLQCVECVK